MPSPKRRFLSADEPTPPPAPVENPFRKVIAAAGILLILVMSVPMFADAVYGQSVPSTPGVDQTSNLISALTSLSTQIGLLKDDIGNLRGQLAAGGSTRTTASAAIDTSMADCLQSCRNRLAICLSQQPATTATNAPLDTCRGTANNCMNNCRPRTETTVGCEDRCAVALGACVVQAGTDSTKLTECRTKNRECVIAACRPRTDKNAPSRVPVEICKDQCNRDNAICRKAAAYDREELAACDAITQKCLTDVCNGYEVRSTAPFLSNLPKSAIEVVGGPPSAFLSTPTETPSTNTENTECTDTCDKNVRTCTAVAGSDAETLQKCQELDVSCRKNCLR